QIGRQTHNRSGRTAVRTGEAERWRIVGKVESAGEDEPNRRRQRQCCQLSIASNLAQRAVELDIQRAGRDRERIGACRARYKRQSEKRSNKDFSSTLFHAAPRTGTRTAIGVP